MTIQTSITEIEIGGVRYTITPLAASAGFPLLAQLAPYLTGPIGALFDAFNGAQGRDAVGRFTAKSVDMSMLVSLLAPAVTEFGRQLATPAFPELVYSLLGGVTVALDPNSGAKQLVGSRGTQMRMAAFDACFTGNMAALVRVFFAALEANVGGFFGDWGGLQGLLDKLTAIGKSTLDDSQRSPRGSTGASPS